MADYNSPYTGAEIDAAVGKSDQIMELAQVYMGAPTNTGILLSSLPVNPGTGDRTGLYEIITSNESTDITLQGAHSQSSRIYVPGEQGTASGSASVGMTDTTIFSLKSKYTGAEDGAFHAYAYSHTFSSGSRTEEETYIHRIYRMQDVE